MPDGAGVPYLARILARVKYPKVKAKIDAKLNEAAQKAGIGRAELDEISVPTHGLDRDGTRRVAFEQGAAVFRVARNCAALEWFNEAGKPLKSPSKAIKDEKELFKEVQSDLKELNADLAIQPQRLQQFYLQSRSWPADIWRSRYLDHPLDAWHLRASWSGGSTDRTAKALRRCPTRPESRCSTLPATGSRLTVRRCGCGTRWMPMSPRSRPGATGWRRCR